MIAKEPTIFEPIAFLASAIALAIAIAFFVKQCEPPQRNKDCIHVGDIRYHGGKACIVERVTVDPETRILIIDETLLEDL